MSDSQGENTSSPNDKFSLAVWFSSILVNICYLISDDNIRQLAITFSPPIGYGLAKLCRFSLKEIQHYRACKVLEDDITRLEAEFNAEGTTKARKTQLRQKIDELKYMLQKRKLNNLDIKPD